MNVVVFINGREAIPVRALPFVAPDHMSPDAIVRLLGHADESGRFRQVFAYQLLPHAYSVRVQPTEWSRIAYRVHALDDRIAREEESGAITENIGMDRWKDGSIKLLPAGVFVWKDEFTSAHFEGYIRGLATADEYKQGGYDPIFFPLISPPELRRVVIEGFEDFLLSEVPERLNNKESHEGQLATLSTPAYDPVRSVSNAATVRYEDLLVICNVEDREDFGGFVVKPDGLHVKAYDTDVLRTLAVEEVAAISTHPTGEYDKPALPLPCTLGDLRTFVVEAGLVGCIDDEIVAEVLADSIRHGQGARVADARDDAGPRRFARCAMQGGFDKGTRERSGERNCEAKVATVNLPDERCIELARLPEVDIADWSELTGIGSGQHGSYLITAEAVAFIKWTEGEICESPVDWQTAMRRENKEAPLRFPCTPTQLVQFIDRAPPEIHCFSVPEAFRQAVTERVQTEDSTNCAQVDQGKQTKPTATRKILPDGEPSAEIITKFRLDCPWGEKLRHIKRYPFLRESGAVMQQGSRNLRTKNLWNPVKFAEMLIRRERKNRVAMARIIADRFPKWQDVWDDAQSIDEPSGWDE